MLAGEAGERGRSGWMLLCDTGLRPAEHGHRNGGVDVHLDGSSEFIWYMRSSAVGAVVRLLNTKLLRGQSLIRHPIQTCEKK